MMKNQHSTVVESSLYANTMKSIKELLAYDHFTSKAVFEHEGNEIVFINEGMVRSVKLYINGNEEASKWVLFSDCTASISSRYDEHSYSVKSQITNLITLAQKITFSVDGSETEVKFDPRLAAFDAKKLVHFFGVVMFLGGVVGLVASLIV